MRTIIVLVGILAACGDNAAPRAPLVDVVTAYPADEYELGIDAWARLGFEAGSNGRECPRYWYASDDFDCTITVQLARESYLRERYGADGLADRETRTIVIDARYSDHLLVHLAAHELGHILLDAGHLEPGAVGIMQTGTAETVASRADFDLACESIGICVP